MYGSVDVSADSAAAVSSDTLTLSLRHGFYKRFRKYITLFTIK